MTALLLWLTCLSAALAGLHAAPLPAHDGVETAFAAVRLVALALGWWLLVSTALGLVVRLVRLRTAVRIVDVFTVPLARSMLNRAMGMLAISALVTPASAFAAERPVAPPPVMRLVQDAPASATPVPTPAAPATTPAEHVVRSGQCFWSIAEDVLAARLGRPPSDAEVVPYWHALIAANADRYERAELIYVGQIFRLP